MPYKNKENALNYGKELRKFCKENQICLRCYEKDAYTMNGRTYCSKCADILAKYKRETVDKCKRNEQRKALRQKHIENHECAVCGIKLQENYTYKLCERCRGKSQNKWAKQHSETYMQRGLYGICWQCNKEKAIEGKRLCENCYNKQLKIELNSLKYVNNGNHIWRKQIQAEVKTTNK